MIACILANVNRGPNDAPFDLTDFLPLTEEERAMAAVEKERSEHQRLAEFLAKGS